MKPLQIFRQGDVLVMRVDSIPKQATPEQLTENRIVLAYGEVTGHAHAIAPTEAKSFTVKEPVAIHDWRCEKFLQVAIGNVARLKHEEHATIELPAGKYAVIQQREYSPEEIRNVAD